MMVTVSAVEIDEERGSEDDGEVVLAALLGVDVEEIAEDVFRRLGEAAEGFAAK